MSNENRYRNGPQVRVQVPVASATVIEVGDFVCVDGGLATTPALLQAAGGGQTTTATVAKDGIADKFVGIALSASGNGDTDDVVVDVSRMSIYEYPLVSAAVLSFGSLIEVDAVSTASISWGCVDQVIEAGTTNPIAVCVKAHSSQTATLIKMIPTTMMDSKASLD